MQVGLTHIFEDVWVRESNQ